MDWTNVVVAITSFLSVVTAAIAIYIAVRSDRRSENRFNSEMQLQERIARANVRPFVAVFTSEFIDNKGIVLSNPGLGTAVIRKIVFARGDNVAKSLPELFALPANTVWDNFRSFDSRRQYLISGKSLDLVRLTVGGLLQQGLSDKEAVEILESWQDQMHGITIKVVYEDVLGNKQDDYEITL